PRMMLYQVLHDDPRPPRRLNDAVPRDLETICLQALGKEPYRRYQSARDLAEDLRAFLTGLPIGARPVGPLERAWRWAWRNPSAAGLLAVSLVAALVGVGLGVSVAYQIRLRAMFEELRLHAASEYQLAVEAHAAHERRADALAEARKAQAAEHAA